MDLSKLKKGDRIIHRYCGVCLISDISSEENCGQKVFYYCLSPLYGEDKGSVLKVPCENAKSLFPLYSKAKLLSMISKWKFLKDPDFINDVKIRKSAYDEATKSGDIEFIAPLLLGAITKKNKEHHLNSMDTYFLNRSQPFVFGIIAEVLSLKIEEVLPYLLSL